MFCLIHCCDKENDSSCIPPGSRLIIKKGMNGNTSRLLGSLAVISRWCVMSTRGSLLNKQIFKCI